MTAKTKTRKKVEEKKSERGNEENGDSRARDSKRKSEYVFNDRKETKEKIYNGNK